MLYKILNFVKLLLPYFIVINLYKRNKAIPANIKTSSGKTLKAVMVTNNYGILFFSDVYYKNRIKYLQEKRDFIRQQTSDLTNELNELSFEARELFLDQGESK